MRTDNRELELKSLELTQANAELRAANERLCQLDSLKDDSISIVAHELRTPLTSIRAFSEMLREDPRMDPVERTRFLGIIVSETERLSRLINQILDLATLESGRAKWASAEVNLSDVIREAVDAISSLTSEKKITLELDLPLPGAIVLADRDRLTQVMINLLSNSLKFVASGSGYIKVGVGETADEVTVSVCDNGPGIRDEDRELIFEKFRQGTGDASTLTNKPQGTGLGLPISRQIIEYFGGKLLVESEFGKGACFRFSLPLDSAKNRP